MRSSDKLEPASYVAVSSSSLVLRISTQSMDTHADGRWPFQDGSKQSTTAQQQHKGGGKI